MDHQYCERSQYEPHHAIPKLKSPPVDQLERPRFWDRLLLGAGSFVVLVGLLGGLSPLMREKFAVLWPDRSGEPWFVAAVSMSVMALFVYLMLQRWDVKIADHRVARLEYDSEERARRHWNHLYGLIDVGRMVGQKTDLEDIFAGITAVCIRSFDADSVSLMLYDASADELVVRSASGPLSNPDILGRRVPLGDGLAGWAARRREPVLLGSNADAYKYPGIELRDDSIAASMVVPIIVRNDLVGVINVSTRAGDVCYGEDDLRTLEVFAENAGSCIRHVEQVTWLRDMVGQLRASGARNAADVKQPAV